MSDSTTIQLDHPIQFGSLLIGELTIQPLRAKHLRGLELDAKHQLDAVLALASRLTGQPNEVIDMLEGRDLQRVLSTVTDFLGAGLAIGSEA